MRYDVQSHQAVKWRLRFLSSLIHATLIESFCSLLESLITPSARQLLFCSLVHSLTHLYLSYIDISYDAYVFVWTLTLHYAFLLSFSRLPFLFHISISESIRPLLFFFFVIYCAILYVILYKTKESKELNP